MTIKKVFGKSVLIKPEIEVDPLFVKIKTEIAKGKVALVGSEVKDIKVGDIVLYGNYQAFVLEDYVLLGQDSIYASL